MILIPRRWAHVLPGEWEELERACAAPMTDDDAIREWETLVARFVGVAEAVAVSSGRVGMTRILEYLQLEPEDEVIIPANTLGRLIPLIQSLKVRVVPADIDAETLNITAETIRRRLTSRTRAIVVLHAFGAPADIIPIMELADKRGIRVIEDCAHSLGASLSGRQTGSFGYAGFFSLETTKPLNTWGGGVVVTRDKDLAHYIRENQRTGAYSPDIIQKKLRAARSEQRLFRTGLALLPLTFLAIPYTNAAMELAYQRMQSTTPAALLYTPIQARLAVKKLALLPARFEKRAELAQRYQSLVAPSIQIQRVLSSATPSWYSLIAVLPRPAVPVRLKLLLKGIDAGVRQEILDDCAAMLGFSDCPVSTSVFQRALALPMFDDLSTDSIDHIASCLNRLI